MSVLSDRVREAWEFELKERKWLFEDVAGMDEPLLVYAGSGVGKSLFALGMTVKAVKGEAFLGFEHGGVEIKACYVDGELSEVDQSQRLKMFGVIGDEELKGKFDYVSLSDQKLDHEGLIKWLEESGYNMVVLDSIRTLFGVDDENAASSWHELGLLVKGLRE